MICRTAVLIILMKTLWRGEELLLLQGLAHVAGADVGEFHRARAAFVCGSTLLGLSSSSSRSFTVVDLLLLRLQLVLL